MFSFFHKRSRVGNLGEGLVCDMHSHLIPGIDDGARELADSLILARGLAELGYKRLITTPHINGSMFRNNPANIGEGAVRVSAALQREQIALEFRAAAEYLLDDLFMDNLSAGKPFLTLKGNLVLVELSFAVPAINLKEILFDLQLKGYQPVLAHPERYLYFAASRGWYDQLRDAGCLFQLNLLSFAGYYGREARELAAWLVKKKYVEFVGTDLHNEKHLQLLRSSGSIYRTVQQLLDAGLLRNQEL